MKPNSTWYANSQRIRILMMSVISGHEMRDPSSLMKTKSYWSTKMNKVQQFEGLESRKSTRVSNCLNLQLVVDFRISLPRLTCFAIVYFSRPIGLRFDKRCGITHLQRYKIFGKNRVNVCLFFFNYNIHLKGQSWTI